MLYRLLYIYFSTTMLLGDEPIHIVYHNEGSNLFVVSAPEKRYGIDPVLM